MIPFSRVAALNLYSFKGLAFERATPFMVINWSKPLEKDMSMCEGLIRGVEGLGRWKHLSSSSSSPHLWGRSQTYSTAPIAAPVAASHEDTKRTGRRWMDQMDRGLGKLVPKGAPWGEERGFCYGLRLDSHSRWTGPFISQAWVLERVSRMQRVFPRMAELKGNTCMGEGENMNMMRRCTVCLYDALSTVTARRQMPKYWFQILFGNEPAFFWFKLSLNVGENSCLLAASLLTQTVIMLLTPRPARLVKNMSPAGFTGLGEFKDPISVIKIYLFAKTT